jgi:hypothetical protein
MSFVKTCAGKAIFSYGYDSNYVYTCTVNTCDILKEKNALLKPVHYGMDYNVC